MDRAFSPPWMVMAVFLGLAAQAGIERAFGAEEFHGGTTVIGAEDRRWRRYPSNLRHAAIPGFRCASTL